MYTSVITAFRYSRNVAAARQMLEELKSDSRVRTSIASYNAYLLVNAVAGILPGKPKADPSRDRAGRPGSKQRDLHRFNYGPK